MSDLCETVSAVLGLYAEGELHDPLAVELVREHLLDCVDCREALEVYDNLTRTLLADGLSGDADGWTDLERQRRVEGVLRRLNWQASTPSLAVTGERARNGSRVPEAAFGNSDALERSALLEPSALLERSDRPRLHLSLDDLVDDRGAATSRQTFDTLGASGPRRFALAAAALLGIVSVWLAADLSGRLSGMLSGNAPDADRQVLRDAPDSLSPVVASSGRDRYDPEPPRREADRPLRWVVGGAGADPRLRLAPSRRRGRAPSEPELLYGVDYRRATPTRSSKAILSSLPNEAEIEWVVEVVILETPPENTEALSEPRYLLVPELVSELGDPSRFDTGGLWFRPGRIERRPVREDAAPRLTIGNSTLYRVCVYEGIRRLELPGRSWTPVRWRTPSTFRREPPHRKAPRPLPTFTGNWLSPGVDQEPNLRF